MILPMRHDNNALSPGHLLAIPRRHVADCFDRTKEKKDVRPGAAGLRETAERSTARAGGQDGMHVHVHLIPRLCRRC
jgi:diadenosine tetraphosphate (Ap4A) HIT family hydrolase